MSPNLRVVGAALMVASMFASVIAMVSIVGGLPRVWPGTILAFITTFGASLMLFGRRHDQ